MPADPSHDDAEVRSGAASVVVTPRAALDLRTGACSVSTPNVAFADAAWSGADATLTTSGRVFDLVIDASDLDMQSGHLGSAENTLTGSITVDGVPFVGLALPLDPTYVRETFDATYLCSPDGGATPAPVLAAVDAMCSFRQVLGNAAARLLVKAAGVATSVLDGNSACGFAAPAVAGAPTQQGTAGGLGALTFTAAGGCQSGFAADTVLAQDCAATELYAAGGFTTTAATKRVEGFLTGDPSHPIFPVSRDAATFTQTGTTFAAFRVYDELADASVPSSATVTGAIDVVVEPIAGRSEAASAAASAATAGAITDVYSVKTPVALMSGLTMATGSMVIVAAGSTFSVQVADADLDALAGAYQGAANDVAGALTVDGELVTIAAGSPLVSPWTQAGFDATYAPCNADLTGPVLP